MTKELSTTLTKDQIELVTKTVAKGATPDELKLFLYTASRTGLDPLTKQIHFVKRSGQMTIQTGIDGYRAIAERSKTLAGIDDAIYDTETGKNPGKASVTVYRLIDGTRVAYTASARWSEYAPQGNQAFMWTKMPYLMLAKCAEALALRKAFPNDLSGLYTNEEMAQADNTVVNTKEEPKTFKEEIEELESRVQERQESVAEQAAKAFDGVVVEDTGKAQKQCPFCKNWHTGQFPKCFDCWKKEKNGQKLVATKTKTLINEEAPPFLS